MAKVSLTVSENKSLDNLRHIVIEVKDDSGNPINEFEKAHEVPMHVVVISNDLQFFEHIHPKFIGKGRFEIDAKFPFGGDYTLFCDYQPSGHSEELRVLSQAVDGEPSSDVVVDTNIRKKRVDNTEISLQVNTNQEKGIKAGDKVKIRFELSQPDSNELVSNINPYLGAEGHLVVVKQSTIAPPVITQDDYIHTHPCSNDVKGQVDFSISFPKPGNYRLWGQFDRGGQMLLSEFWVKVS